MRSLPQTALLSALALSFVLLAGCGSNMATSTPPPPPTTEPDNCKSTHTTSPAQPAPTANLAGPAITGFVKAGQQPIAGASVGISVAGDTGNGSSSNLLLLTTPIGKTDANGAFTIPAGYICPYSNSLLYIGATVGDVDKPTGSSINLTAVLGPCGALPSTPFTINEATTVATAYAMAQFISTSTGSIGATATNSSGLLLAAANAASLVDPVTGTFPAASFPATGTAPIAKLDTLANLLNACVVTSPTSSACTSLFSASPTVINGIKSSATDPFLAAKNIAQHPATNIASLYTLSQASAVYSPALTSAPPDWTLAVNYTGGGMNAPSAVAIDSTGRVWVANYFSVASLFTNTGIPLYPNGIVGDDLYESYGGALDVDDNFWVADEESAGPFNDGLGSVSVLNNSGVQTGNYIAGGINFPLAVAFDTSGVSWVVDYGNSHITLLDPTGNPLSGTSGYTAANLVFPVAVATDAKCNAYVANPPNNTITRVLADGSSFTDFAAGDGPSGLAIDATGNIWSANYYGDSVGLVSSSGTVLSGTGYTGGGLSHPQGIAVDGSGTVWVVNYRSPALSELAGATTTTPGEILSPAAGWATDSGLSEAFGLAIDASGNLWATSFATSTVTEFVGLATPVQTPQLGPVRIP